MTVKEKTVETTLSTDVDHKILNDIKALSRNQLQWLSGYCAGLYDGRNEVSDSDEIHQQVGLALNLSSSVRVLVLYASQTGNAESVASNLHDCLVAEGVSSSLSSTLDIKLKALKDYTSIIVIASTHGEGEPPDDAIDFYEAIHSKKAPNLVGVSYAVLGLGDSSYEYYCQTAKDFDAVFKALGAQSIIERKDCDIDYESAAKQWISDVTQKISNQERQNNNKVLVPEKAFIGSERLYSKDNPYRATISTIQKITGVGSTKDTYHLEIDIAGSGITYQPGDALAVIPCNKKELVAEVLANLSFSPEQQVKYAGETLSIEKVLSEKLELTLLSKQTLQELYKLSKSYLLKDILESNYSEYIDNHQFVDVLKILDVNLTPQQLVDLLKPLKPRLYSIASSQDEVSEEIHVTLNHVCLTNENGQRFGVASHFLTQVLNENDELLIYVDSNNNFKLPDESKDLIMVGPGTGIAPFRSFLQQRDNEQAKGRNWLFFGNPNFNTDFLYQTELQKYLQTGVLTKLDVAFSRDQESKIYVQDRIKEAAAELWQWLESGAHIYVCGDMHRMAKDVESTLLEVIELSGNKTPEQAKEYLKQLKKDKRYQRDVY
ncbi:MAG: assimilatory sulfite reductase (NADPH) flavoprotein subunit [Kangiellaceae bacterium]|nr:assimilatory sulfite reductase (NADPH) flavoprotein subunit [Kangiellaceae bacterium]